jgi:hypothetical protein
MKDKNVKQALLAEGARGAGGWMERVKEGEYNRCTLGASMKIEHWNLTKSY